MDYNEPDVRELARVINEAIHDYDRAERIEALIRVMAAQVYNRDLGPHGTIIRLERRIEALQGRAVVRETPSMSTAEAHT